MNLTCKTAVYERAKHRQNVCLSSNTRFVLKWYERQRSLHSSFSPPLCLCTSAHSYPPWMVCYTTVSNCTLRHERQHSRNLTFSFQRILFTLLFLNCSKPRAFISCPKVDFFLYPTMLCLFSLSMSAINYFKMTAVPDTPVDMLRPEIHVTGTLSRYRIFIDPQPACKAMIHKQGATFSVSITAVASQRLNYLDQM